MEAWQTRVWLAQEKLEDAVQWVLKRSLDTTEELTYVGGFEYIALSRILFAQSRLDETTELLHRLLKAAEAEGHTSRVIEIMILQALTFQTAEDTAQAITTLEKALSLAEPGGFIRIFVDEGTPLEALLKKIRVEDGRIKKYIHKLLGAFKGNKTQLSTDGQQPLVEPLSERELEVLDLIAKGLSNQQVASRLFLSLNTIKSHTRNIHQKLGVNSRTQAVASAKSLGIITPDNVQ
jgi:LuxR family maltose regulon positive regulatory protein